MTLYERTAQDEGYVPNLALDPGKDARGDPLNQINTGHGHSMDEFTPEAWAVLLPLVKAGVPLFAGRGLGTSKKQASDMLLRRLDQIQSELIDRSEAVVTLLSQGTRRKHPDKWARADVLIKMAYQMGVDGLLGFKRMLAAVEREDWEAAAREVVWRDGSDESKGRSALWKQTPKRAEFYAETLRTGVAS